MMNTFAPSYTDLHCDTAYELYKQKAALLKNNLHISLDKADCFNNYTQIMAFWSDCALSDEDAYKAFFKMRENLLSEINTNADKAALCFDYRDIKNALTQKKAAFILSVEDARILGGDLSRLEILYSCGIRFLTLQWKGKSCIGGGYDTDLPLSAFGQEVVKGCFELGIIPDISHACEKTADDILDIAEKYGKAVIATHSDSFKVCPHPRNLSDLTFRKISECGGLIGISLCPAHLSPDEKADGESVAKHIEHWLSIGGENSICFGCDFDGIDAAPADIQNISHIAGLYNFLEEKGFPAKNIFSENADFFLSNNL